jgi:Arc/MetJ family transcription regulator
MATNLALDDSLIEEARRAGKHKTKKEAVTAALGEYIERRKQVRILEAFGSFEFDPATTTRRNGAAAGAAARVKTLA